MDYSKNAQLVVIGSGPGGYAAASLAADRGLKVTLIDREPFLGGICLHCGCIPSKALLHITKIITDAKEAKAFGVTFSEPQIDINTMRSWKENVVKKLSGGLSQLCKQRNITVIQGHASFENSNTLRIEKGDGAKDSLSFEKAVIATGSKPITIDGLQDPSNILNSTDALALKEIPETLLVVGGGYIGLELGSIYAALGTKVTVAEMTEGLLPGVDRDLVFVLDKRLKNAFDSILLNTKIAAEKSQEFKKVLIAVGRKPDTSALGLENTKVEIDKRGFVKVNKCLQTTDKNIYAIGDIAGDPMLAHKASAQGHTAVESMTGKKAEFKPRAIPAVVFTDPEIAWCGLTETQAKKENIPVAVAKFPWAASGKAATLNRNDGVTKLILDVKTQRVLGVGIAGVGAGELIAEGVLAVETKTTAKDIKNCIHPHPTLSETIQNTAESFLGECAHIYKPKK